MMKKGWLAVVATVALVVGCGESGPRLVPVTGVVLLNGQPVEGAVLTFEPDPSNSNTAARPGEAVTDAAGKYEVSTSLNPGVVFGKYQVTVTKTSLDAAKDNPAFQVDPYMAQLSAAGPEVGKKAKKKDGSSGVLEVKFDREVPEAGGPQDFELRATK